MSTEMQTINKKKYTNRQIADATGIDPRTLNQRLKQFNIKIYATGNHGNKTAKYYYLDPDEYKIFTKPPAIYKTANLKPSNDKYYWKMKDDKKWKETIIARLPKDIADKTKFWLDGFCFTEELKAKSRMRLGCMSRREALD